VYLDPGSTILAAPSLASGFSTNIGFYDVAERSPGRNCHKSWVRDLLYAHPHSHQHSFSKPCHPLTSSKPSRSLMFEGTHRWDLATMNLPVEACRSWGQRSRSSN
jgi:hypothetical protein